MESTLKVCDTVLSFAGIRIFSTKWNSKFWLSIQTFCFLIGVLALIFTSGFILQNIIRNDIISLLKGASIWSTCIILSISLAICLIFRRQFRQFLSEVVFVDLMLEMPLVKFCFQNERIGTKMNELRDVVTSSREKLMNFTRKLMMLYTFLVFFNSNLYLFDAIYRMIITKNPDERLFGYDMWFPWDIYPLRAYIPTFIFHAHAGFLCSIAYPGLQVTIMLLVGEILRQIKILSYILLNLESIGKEIVGCNKNDWQNSCTVILTQCLDHYVKLKSFSDRLNRICRTFYLTLILDSTIVVCMCSVKIAISDKLATDTMKYYALGLSFIGIVFAFCYLGQMVENECENLERAVDENWYIYDYKHKKYILIFKMAARKGMSIYIFGSTTLSLPTFTWFLRNGMSFFTLLMSVLET